MYRRQDRYAQKAGQFRHRQDRPERQTVAELVRLDPGHHETARLSGVLATLDRIGRLPVIGSD
jgi:hypothetical protein